MVVFFVHEGIGLFSMCLIYTRKHILSKARNSVVRTALPHRDVSTSPINSRTCNASIFKGLPFLWQSWKF